MKGQLPERFQILPATVPFYVPGFGALDSGENFVLAPGPVDCGRWFDDFVARVSQAVGVAHLPVCRMSDGEFLLLFGVQPPSPRHSLPKRIRIRCRQAVERIRSRFLGFRACTAPGISSGAMSYAEIASQRPVLSRAYGDVASKGILALHLSHSRVPFQEQYFPAVGQWLKRENIALTLANYAPFYFVYGLLRGPAFPRLVAGRRLLMVHSAVGAKRDAIVKSLQAVGPRSIEWLGISATRSFAETLDLSRLQEKPDICLIGAGVGKAALFPQLEPLQVPCIDAGYTFEVWADPDRQWDRPFMTPDSDMDVSRVRYLSKVDHAALAARSSRVTT